MPHPATETRLRELKKQQRDKVEELKKKTGYYSTRQILEKYDEVVKKNVSFCVTRHLPLATCHLPPVQRPRPRLVLTLALRCSIFVLYSGGRAWLEGVCAALGRLRWDPAPARVGWPARPKRPARLKPKPTIQHPPHRRPGLVTKYASLSHAHPPVPGSARPAGRPTAAPATAHAARQVRRCAAGDAVRPEHALCVDLRQLLHTQRTRTQGAVGGYP